ncbi:MAG: hypothetical protein MJ252_27970 [archaeon]|nr:hypothetical protein [archaeon]
MKRKTNKNLVRKIQNYKALEDFKRENEVSVIYFGDNATEIKDFESASRIIDDYYDHCVFGIVGDNKVLEKLKLPKGTVALFKHTDELVDLMEYPFNNTNIVKFVHENSDPLLMTFDDHYATLLFAKNVPGIILFRDGKADNAKKLEEILYTAAKKFKGKLQAVVSDIRTDLEEKMAEYCGVKPKHLPTIRIGDSRQERFKHYKMEGEINEKNILSFVDNWKNGKLKVFMKSEEIPKEQKKPVYKLVGKTFHDLVVKSPKDVLVFFYAPWCK